jgi:HAE1 family hydrophobic/amphiphilic exporter-1
VGRTLAFAMRGQQLPDYYEGSREVDVYARFRLEDRADFDRLMDFPLWSPFTQEAVPIRAVTEQSVAKGFGNIERTNRKTGMTLNLELAPDVEMDNAWGAVGSALEGMQFPRGYGWAKGREAMQQVEDDRARNLALGLSITLVFLIMGVLLESFLLPMAILTTIPMALLGVWWTLYFTGTPVDGMAGVGLVILIGVVVNNGIVLLDLVTQLRRGGMDRTEALLTAGTRRLRPILMTALTTIFGLLPMAVGDRTFIGIPYAPLGQVVAGGLATATLLTLFVLPYLYALLDDLRSASWRALVFAWPRSRTEATPSAGP